MNTISRVSFTALALLATTAESRPFDRDTGWGAPYNSHLDSYSGRSLGPPLPQLPPGSQYYNGRLRVPYAGPGVVYVPNRRPHHPADRRPSAPGRR